MSFSLKDLTELSKNGYGELTRKNIPLNIEDLQKAGYGNIRANDPGGDVAKQLFAPKPKVPTVQELAQQELDYLNSREYAYKRDRELASLNYQMGAVDRAKVAMGEANNRWRELSNNNATPVQLAEAEAEYNAAQQAYWDATVAYDDLAAQYEAVKEGVPINQRRELELLAAGGERLMQQVKELAELDAERDKANILSVLGNTGRPEEDKAYQAAFDRLAKIYGEETVDLWVGDAIQARNAEESDKKNKADTQWGRDSSDIASWNAAVGLDLLSGIGYVDALLQKAGNAIRYGPGVMPVDYNTWAQRPAQKAAAIRAGATEDKTAFGSFLYNATGSMATSAIAMATGRAGQAILGLSAATNAMQAAAARGVSDDQALLIGLVSGGMELVTEKIQFDRVFGAKSADDVLPWVVKVLKNAGLEGTEEGFTTLANTIADGVIAGDKSELNTMVQNYVDQGYSLEDAQKKALADWGKGLGLDIAGGAFSGGVMTGLQLGGSAAYKGITSRGNTNTTQPTATKPVTEQAQPVTPVTDTVQQTPEQMVADAMSAIPTADQRVEQAVQDMTGQNKTAPVIEFTDGTTQTREQFVQTVLNNYPGTTAEQANAAFDQFLAINERGGKIRPIEQQAVQAQNDTQSPVVNGNIGEAEANPAVSAADAGFSPYSHAQLQYGTIPPGENPARVVGVPQSVDGKSNVMQTVRTILEADATPDAAIPELENAIVDGKFSQMPITDQEAADRAEATIRQYGYQQALADWMADVRNGKVSKDSVVVGETLYNAAVNAGDTKSAVKIAIQLSVQARSAAQALQAIRMLKKMSPAARLYGIKQSVDNLQKTLTDKYGSRAPNLVINEELAAKFLEAETDEAKTAAEEALYKDIAQQIPATFADKWNAWRYLSMLGNARTHIRNIAGSAMLAPIRFVKNKLGAVTEAGAQKMGLIDQSQRTKAIGPVGKELMDVAKADYANVEQQIMSAGKYNSASDIIEKNRQIFTPRVASKIRSEAAKRGTELPGWVDSISLESLRKGNSTLLELEDSWFSKSAYASSLASYLKAQGFTATDFTGDGMTQEQKDAARAYAIKEAQKATYRDVNAFSNFVSSIGFRAPGDNIFKKGTNAVIEGTMPFKNTPANILARGVEYSPIGLLKAITTDIYQVKKGKITAGEYMDRLSSGLTGTALFGLGCLLSNLGILRGGTPEDEDQYELEGRQPYSLEIGDTSITLDWLAPEAMPVFMGVELMEAIKEGGGEAAFTDKLISFLNGLSGPMLEMSMMSSLQDALESTEYADNKIMAFLANGALGYLKQGLPTVFGQLERAIGEPTREATFLDKGAKIFGTDAQYAIASAANKIPVVDYNQIPYVDAWGRMEYTGDLGGRLFNNMLNPAYVSRIEETPVDTEIKRLEKNLGINLTPSRAKGVITVNGREEILTAKEFVTYAQAKGQNDLTFRQNLIDSDVYKGLDDQTKAKAMEYSKDLADVLAVQEAGFTPKLSGWQKELVGADSETITSTLIQKAIESELGSGSQRYTDISTMVSQNTIDDNLALALLTDNQYEKYNEFCTYANVPVTSYLEILGVKAQEGTKQEQVKARIERVTQDNKQRRALWCTLYSKNTIPGEWWK